MEEVRVGAQNVLVTGPADGTPVLLVHGNCSSAAYWLPLLRHLPPTLRVVAPDLRSLGLVPGWPGAGACPPQPMVGQTRAVLERYTAAGGTYREVVYPNCGHSPHVEFPTQVATELLRLI
jgi:pimeloyl-ACP methyl ester carboxylesterase